MVDETVSNALSKIAVLAESIAKLADEKTDAQSRILEEHSRILADIRVNLERITERTSNHVTLIDRVTELEKGMIPMLTVPDRVAKLEGWRAVWAGALVAASVFGGIVGWAVNVVINVHH